MECVMPCFPFTVWSRFETWPVTSLALLRLPCNACTLSGVVGQPHRSGSVHCRNSHQRQDARSERNPTFPLCRAAAIRLSGGGTVRNVWTEGPFGAIMLHSQEPFLRPPDQRCGDPQATCHCERLWCTWLALGTAGPPPGSRMAAKRRAPIGPARDCRPVLARVAPSYRKEAGHASSARDAEGAARVPRAGRRQMGARWARARARRRVAAAPASCCA